MARFTLRALSSFELRGADGREIALPGKRPQALLAYLALQPDYSQSREHLATLLWGDRFEEQARRSLRQCLLTLRRALGDENATVIVSERESLRLDGARFEVDARRFETLTSTADPEELERGVELYSGDLLEGFSIKAEEFASWLTRERGRLRERAVDALVRLSRLQAEAGETEKALRTARKVPEIDPVREDGHRLLMRLYDLAGKRAEALKQYQICEQILRRELDVIPEEETVRLATEIRSRTGDVWPPPALVTVPESSGSRSWLARFRIHLAAAVLLVVAGAVAGSMLWSGIGNIREKARQERMVLPLPEKPSIVVLPFDNLNNDPAHQDLVDGITEEITTALSMVSEMFVISRNTALTYGDQPADAREVAEQLGVRYVLEGSVRVADDRVRVAAELIDAIEGFHTWAGRYEREMIDVFALQDAITLEIVTALQVEMTEGEQDRIALIHGTDNLPAWILAAQALKQLRRLTPQDNAKARALYGQAAELDPTYPGAWDGLAWTHFIDARFAWSDSRRESIRKAAELAQRTLALDPARPPTYALLGGVQLLNGDHAQAVALAEKAVALSPNGADVTAILALTLTYTGDYERSVALLQRAMRLSPYYSDWYRWTLGRAYRLMGRFRDAEAALTARGDEGGGSLLRLVELTIAYGQMGRNKAARDTAKRVLAARPGFSAREWTSLPPHKDAKVMRAELETLRRAGLPE